MKKFLEEVKKATDLDLANEGSFDSILKHLLEELGELAKAYSVEVGTKKSKIKESSKEESVDVIVCGLSLFYILGGDDEFLSEYGLKKLKKWTKNLKKKGKKKK